MIDNKKAPPQAYTTHSKPGFLIIKPFTSEANCEKKTTPVIMFRFLAVE